MQRDLRDTELYRAIEEHFRRALEPGFGRITAAADLSAAPDGSRLAFTGYRLDRLEGGPCSRIVLADLPSGDLEEVTAGPNDDRLPVWSPDGSAVAFCSNRRSPDRFQAYLLARGRIGEAEALPEVDGSVESIAWSPDGRRLLVTAAGPGADLAGAAGSGAMARPEGLPSWAPDVESSDGADVWRRAWIVDLENREAARIGDDTATIWEACWCGDGALAAIVSDEPGEGAWYGAHLALIDAETGATRDLLRSDVQLGLPCASGDGSRVAVVEALCSDRTIVAGDLLVVEVASGDLTRVGTASVDVTAVAWRDRDRLFAIGLRGLETVACDVDAATGGVAETWSTRESCGAWYPTGCPVGEEAFAVVLESHRRPPELTLVRAGEAVTLASFAHEGTRYLTEILGTAQEVTWEAPDGLALQGLLVTPGTPGPHALVVIVHGGPVWAYTDRWPRAWMHPIMARGYAVFLPNPRGSGGRGRAFAAQVVGDMGGADALDVLSGIDALVERGVADPSRIGVTGGSYGGFMSCWLPTLDQRFAAAVALSPVTDWTSQHFDSNIGRWDADFLRSDPTEPVGPYRERSPVMHADRVRTPTLVTAGRNDRCTPPGQAVEFHRALRARGVETDLVLYPEEGHGVRRFPAVIDLCTRMVAWFEDHMPPATGRVST